jgi:hexulose-6-phosphate isomerase
LGGALAVSRAFNSEGVAAPRQDADLMKAACISVFPRDASVMGKFRMAADAGFEGIEPNTIGTPEEVDEYRKAAEATGVKVHSIMNADHWRYSLTDDDPEVVQLSVEGIKTSLQNAKDLGAGVVLLVPGIVTARVRYAQVYERSHKEIRKLLPLAEKLGVVIGIENVGNRFLLSPLEFAQYVDEFESPNVQAYFDVGNVVRYGFPQDWVRTLAHRLVRIHVKHFEPGREHPAFDPKDNRTEGIDWPDVRKALAEVGYKGYVSAEVRSGDEAYVKEVSARMDKMFAGEDPVPR